MRSTPSALRPSRHEHSFVFLFRSSKCNAITGCAQLLTLDFSPTPSPSFSFLFCACAVSAPIPNGPQNKNDMGLSVLGTLKSPTKQTRNTPMLKPPQQIRGASAAQPLDACCRVAAMLIARCCFEIHVSGISRTSCFHFLFEKHTRRAVGGLRVAALALQGKRHQTRRCSVLHTTLLTSFSRRAMLL